MTNGQGQSVIDEGGASLRRQKQRFTALAIFALDFIHFLKPNACSKRLAILRQ